MNETCTCCYCKAQASKKAWKRAELESWLKAAVEAERERQSRPLALLIKRARALLGL